MEWNTKWDWENHEIFSSKVITSSPKKLQSTNYGIGIGDGDDDIDGSFNLSGVVGGSGGSASDMGNSSVSASTESSFKDGNGNGTGTGTGIGISVSEFQFQSTTAFPNTFKKEFESPPLLEPSVSSGEAFIGLKLGKRTYFENNNSTTSSVSTVKKVKPSSQSTPTPAPRCQVEGCNLDLSSAKEYHRKHRVCESHSKSPKVVVSGVDRRFCQQCSRFHGLSEFDEKKRSCRRRLSDHNARRRKPQQETIQFNSTNLSSSFYGPVIQSRAGVAWENSNMPGTVGLKRSVPLKGTRVEEVLDQGFKDPTTNVDALDLRRALSLLSNNNSWDGHGHGIALYDHPPDLLPPHDHHNPLHLHTDNPIHSVPIGVPLHSPDYWHPPIDSSPKTTTNTQFQEFQLFNRFYG